MISFFVAGIPVPKGSAKAYVNKHTGKAAVIQDNREKQKPWASSISYTAQQHAKGVAEGPTAIDLTFIMPRPKSHFGTGKNSAVLKQPVKFFHTSKPDLDKLIRCVKDALTGVIWKDDSQVYLISAKKAYGAIPGVQVEIHSI